MEKTPLKRELPVVQTRAKQLCRSSLWNQFGAYAKINTEGLARIAALSKYIASRKAGSNNYNGKLCEPVKVSYPLCVSLLLTDLIWRPLLSSKLDSVKVHWKSGKFFFTTLKV